MPLNQNNTRSQKQKVIMAKAMFQSGSGKINDAWLKNAKNSSTLVKTLCHHVLTGRVKAHKLCLKNYECYHCAYDQMIDDENMDCPREKMICQ